MKTRLAWIFVCAGLGAACGEKRQTEAAEDRPQKGGTLVIAIPNEPDAANSLLSGERYGQEINRNILYLPLITYNEKLELQPALAESWEMDGDSAVTFKIRRDVYWHDGVHTTAHDVLFTFERGRNPETGYPNADYWAGWMGAQVTDSFTIRFRMQPQPEPLGNLPWIPVMPRHLLESVAPADLKNAPFNQRPVGNGPFTFVEHRANDRWVFAANDKFPQSLGGRPNVDRLILRIIPEASAQITELRTGNVHMIMPVGASDFSALRTDPALRGVVMPSRQYSFIPWNTQRAPFNDVRFRRALTFAMDRQEIVDVLRGSYGRVAAGPVPPFHWSNDTTIKPLAYSPDSSKAILAALGMRDRNQDGFVELANGKPLQIELKFAAASQAQRDLAELVRADLQAVGIKLVPRPMDFSAVVEHITTQPRNFDGAIMGFENDVRLVLRDMFHSSAKNAPYQFASYSNAEVDSLLDRLNATVSREEAAPLWRRLQTVLRDEQPWTFLFYYSELVALRNELRGANPDIRGFFVDIPRWWLAAPTSTTAQ
jgi:peptide/nickel transport system substrate-binding protein